VAGEISFSEFPPPLTRGDRSQCGSFDARNLTYGPSRTEGGAPSNISPRPGTRQLTILPTSKPVTSTTPPTLLLDSVHLLKRVGGQPFFTVSRRDGNPNQPGYGTVLMIGAIAAVGGSGGFSPAEPPTIPVPVPTWEFNASTPFIPEDAPAEWAQVINSVFTADPSTLAITQRTAQFDSVQSFGADAAGNVWYAPATDNGGGSWTVNFHYRDMDGVDHGPLGSGLTFADGFYQMMVAARPTDSGLWLMVQSNGGAGRLFDLYDLNTGDGAATIGNVIDTASAVFSSNGGMTLMPDGDLMFVGGNSSDHETKAWKIEPQTGAVRANYPVALMLGGGILGMETPFSRVAALKDGRVLMAASTKDEGMDSFAGIVAYTFDDAGVVGNPDTFVDLTALVSTDGWLTTYNRIWFSPAWDTLTPDAETGKMVVVAGGTLTSPGDWAISHSSNGTLTDITANVFSYGDGKMFTSDQTSGNVPLWANTGSLYLGMKDGSADKPSIVELSASTGAVTRSTVADSLAEEGALLLNCFVNYDPANSYLATQVVG